MKSHIVGIDEDLWDIVVEGIDFLVDCDGMCTDRKNLTDAQKKIYRKHHRKHSIM
ncbi:F-box/LRR-repeat protein, partial [Trifolium medium]|nr:F-box/LRR-repeat protein [Trifolium medium]